ncbi:MAG TPA: hypothetical protein VGJ20_18530 [Xanthobacteraceae bacterium]
MRLNESANAFDVLGEDFLAQRRREGREKERQEIGERRTPGRSGRTPQRSKTRLLDRGSE